MTMTSSPTIERISLSNGHEALRVQVSRTGTPPFTFRGVPDKNPDGKRTLGKTPDLILASLSDTPGASIPQLAQQLDKSSSAIERAIRKLRAEGRLVRIGPAKGGHWQVVK
jgi:biotin operon repressor